MKVLILWNHQTQCLDPYVPRKRYRLAVKSRNLDEQVAIWSRKRTSENPNAHHVTFLVRLFVEALILDKLAF